MAHKKRSHFTDYLEPSQIIYDLKATDKIDALEEMLVLLEKQNLIKTRKPILTRIIDRERLETTGIGHHVALPHARFNTKVKDIAVVVGRSPAGIDFNAIDREKVNLIILIVWNPAIPGLFNHLFAGLANFLVNSNFRERLFNAESAAQLYDVLSEIELSLPAQEERIIHRAGLLWKLQGIELKKKKASSSKKKELQQQAELIRSELDEALLDRFDRLMERYGFAVAEVEDGVCQGCYINVATGMSSAIEGSNDIYVCENCGKFLVSAKTKKSQESS
ncbi:MAG: PTS sugar transporter subunit IIA [Candidatus Aminicenantaceae bacterium]